MNNVVSLGLGNLWRYRAWRYTKKKNRQTSNPLSAKIKMLPQNVFFWGFLKMKSICNFMQNCIAINKYFISHNYWKNSLGDRCFDVFDKKYFSISTSNNCGLICNDICSKGPSYCEYVNVGIQLLNRNCSHFIQIKLVIHPVFLSHENKSFTCNFCISPTE